MAEGWAGGGGFLWLGGRLETAALCSTSTTPTPAPVGCRGWACACGRKELARMPPPHPVPAPLPAGCSGGAAGQGCCTAAGPSHSRAHGWGRAEVAHPGLSHLLIAGLPCAPGPCALPQQHPPPPAGLLCPPSAPRPPHHPHPDPHPYAQVTRPVGRTVWDTDNDKATGPAPAAASGRSKED